MTEDENRTGDDPEKLYTADALEAEVISIEKARKKLHPKNWSYGPSLSSWLGEDEPDADDSADWYLRGLVPRGVPFIIGGDPKTGKTMLVESWSIALAMGAPDWCGFPIGERRRVLLMPREDAERTTKIRLWQLARGAGLQRPHDLERFLSVDPTSPLDMNDPDHLKRLATACERFDVVFVDAFATSHHGDENSTKDMAKVMGAARDLAMSTNTAIGFIHHFNGKGIADDQRSPIHRLRGSSAIASHARHVVGAARGKEKGQVVLSADGNFEFKPDPFVVALVNGEANGKRTLRYELRGDAKQVGQASEDALVDDAILRVLAKAGGDGWGAKDLRSMVTDHLKSSGSMPDGVRGSRIDNRASELQSQGRIDREIGGKKRWKGLL